MNYIIDPDTFKTHSIFSSKGKKLLKNYVTYVQTGGMFSLSIPAVANHEAPPPPPTLEETVSKLYEQVVDTYKRKISGYLSSESDNIFVKLKSIGDNYIVTGMIGGSPWSRIDLFSFQRLFSFETDPSPEKLNLTKMIFETFIENIEREYKNIVEVNEHAIILPSLENSKCIDSKLDYLIILQKAGLIDDSNTTLLLKYEEEEETEVKEKLYEQNETPNFIIKVPFSGNKHCVYPVFDELFKPEENFQYYKKILVSQKKDLCIGYNYGLIVEKWNPNFLEYGEYRCYCVSGEIYGVILDKIGDVNYFACKKDIIPVQHSSQHAYLFKEDNEENIQKLKSLQDLCTKVYNAMMESGYDLTCNRIDCVQRDDGTFKVNEIESIAYGDKSEEQFQTNFQFSMREILMNAYVAKLMSSPKSKSKTN